MESDGSSEIKQVEQSSSDKTDSSAKEREIAARKGGRTWPPLSFLSILKDANIEIDMSCPHKLCDLLYAGKYFVDKKSNKNCFALFPREFHICWGENPKDWKWTQQMEPSGEDIEVAELLDVCWLEVRGKIDTIDLSPGALYEIVFILKVYGECSGEDIEVAELLDVCWLEVRGKIDTIDLSPGALYEIVFILKVYENPNDDIEKNHISNYTLTLTIIPPRVKRLSRQAILKENPVGNWFEIVVGEFIMSPENIGIMEFSIEEYTPTWKNGLTINCAIIRPKK
ncbi:hypothetical protein CsSME_00016475 [Camellia sinensis var. sinensis]